MTRWTAAVPPGPQPAGPAPSNLPHPAPPAEHAALLQDPSGFDLLRRKDDFLDEGVATVFGIRQGEAELQAFCFHPGRFSPEQAQDWLRERGLEPHQFRAATETGPGVLAP
jgi:hypothetical protein